MKQTHKKLIEIIEKIPSDRKFISTDKFNFTYGEILNLNNQFKIDFPNFFGESCAIICDDAVSLSLYLPVFDNVFNTIFLLPNDINDKDEFLKSAQINYLINISQCEIKNISHVDDIKFEKNRHTTYILATSGTTDKPKLATYTLDNLMSTTKNDISRGIEFVWGLTYDINRFAGLQVYLQVISSGSKLVICENNASISDYLDLFSSNNVNCISATPSFWRKMLMDKNHVNLNLKRITLGGEISTQNIISALNKSFLNASIVHIYASTETGVGFVVKDKLEGFPVEYLNDNDKPYKLKIIDDNLYIKNANCCKKYVKGNLDIDNDGYINTGDKVKINNDRVVFLGRENGSINVGGNKVMPEKVEKIIEQHEYIINALVYAKSNPILGSLVGCEIVLKDEYKNIDFKDIKLDVLEYCKKHLNSFEVPVFLKKVNSIKINSTGKKVRN